MRRYGIVFVVLVSAVSFLIGAVVTGGLIPAPALSAQPVRGTMAPVARRTAAGAAASAPNFADVAERLNAAVVNIDAASRGGHPRRRSDEDGDSTAPASS